jgi:hypothetical protein
MKVNLSVGIAITYSHTQIDFWWKTSPCANPLYSYRQNIHKRIPHFCVISVTWGKTSLCGLDQLFIPPSLPPWAGGNTGSRQKKSSLYPLHTMQPIWTEISISPSPINIKKISTCLSWILLSLSFFLTHFYKKERRQKGLRSSSSTLFGLLRWFSLGLARLNILWTLLETS